LLFDTPTVKDRFDEISFIPNNSTPEQFKALNKDDLKKLDKLLKMQKFKLTSEVKIAR
jgi:tripartite-type tricarboxylate transporter receptor subunit TctC